MKRKPKPYGSIENCISFTKVNLESTLSLLFDIQKILFSLFSQYFF